MTTEQATAVKLPRRKRKVRAEIHITARPTGCEGVALTQMNVADQKKTLKTLLATDKLSKLLYPQ